MPYVIPLVVAAVSATVGGLELAGVGQPSQSDTIAAQNKQLDAERLQQLQQQQQDQQKAIRASLANAQSQGGGSLGGNSLVDLASVIAGVPGESNTSVGQGALASYLGTPGASTTPGGGITGGSSGGSGGSGIPSIGTGDNPFNLILQQLAGKNAAPGGGGDMVSTTFGLNGSQG